MSTACSILIPAHNEAGYIEPCLEALLASDATGAAVEVIVMCNGCRDGTAGIARGYATQFAARGWPLTVLDLAQGGKMGALNAGDRIAQHGARIYVDADGARGGQCLYPRLCPVLGQLAVLHPWHARFRGLRGEFGRAQTLGRFS
jgi:cellulose synthase/poly-beta-1,6-N-acetylglucosamine synthase-like glycosyltransferase